MSTSPLQRQSVFEGGLGELGKNKRKRQASIYDAVAGYVTTNGFKVDSSSPSQPGHIIAAGALPLFPEEVLFQRKRAPQRYQEHDFYWADQDLPLTQPLPNSDLVKAIHVYTSEFYSRATADGGQLDFRSMEETALLALSILLEEASKCILGQHGSLVFVEGEEEIEVHGGTVTRISNREGRPSMRNTSLAAQRSGDTRRRKKIRLDIAAWEGSDG